MGDRDRGDPASTTLADFYSCRRSLAIFGSVGIAVEAVEPRAENGVTYGGKSWPGRWAVNSFFSALRLRGGDTGGRRRRSS